ncbi:MAG: glycoside hydrolase family 95 protein, partial [Prevotella sp.]|nr:glycoside hydrolase family 95 protein [Prevotella sp.]
MKQKLLLTALLILIAQMVGAQSHRLWYARPASHWLEALPVGNSHLGAMIYGGTDVEEIQLNEETFWSGSPHNNDSQEALEYLPQVRQLIFDGKEREAHKLMDEHFVKGPHGMRYLPLVSLKLKFGHNDVTGYERALNLGDATATTSYIYNGVRYQRTVFASQADNVIVVRLTADKENALAFGLNIISPLPSSVHTQPVRISSGVRQQMVASVKNVEQEGIPACLEAECRVEVVTDGRVTDLRESLRVDDATTAVLYITAATNFVNYHDVSADPARKNTQVLDGVYGRDYKKLLKAHVDKYQEQYNRVSLTLPRSEVSMLETDLRLAKFSENSK